MTLFRSEAQRAAIAGRPPVFYHLAVWRRPRLELRFYFSAEVKVTVEICEPVAVKPPSRPRFVE
jgi:hypothetical protein